jgi:hypothetical protein
MFFLIGATDYYGFLGDFDIGKKPVGKPDLEELHLMNCRMDVLRCWLSWSYFVTTHKISSRLALTDMTTSSPVFRSFTSKLAFRSVNPLYLLVRYETVNAIRD